MKKSLIVAPIFPSRFEVSADLLENSEILLWSISPVKKYDINDVKRKRDIKIKVLPMKSLLALESFFFCLFFENEKICFIELNK